ncbi:non-ribosomal peptide synthetase [[Clostridium] polysaccharolyticum]|uniref:Amino acid adenylation domain-containing protein n=1 Tax=[Clostridium] polysaccharolyticum TaxID=29364 RepID=A0A1I0AEK0_9FIRM|nr:non-ribosomal peptide synthetase [[Clostridium] polysaccharolyticum]SES92613.1 amino acid adenylation domain-containing protein [[Clostridium] polysaccharolyticum]
MKNSENQKEKSERTSELSAESRTLIQQFNDTEKEISYQCLGELLEISYQKHKNEAAVFMSEKRYTYRELYSMAKTIGKRLSRMGIGRNGRVALVFDKGFEQVAAVLGVVYAGAAYVPIDCSYPSRLACDCINQVNAELVITRQENVPLYQEAKAKVYSFEECIRIDDSEDFMPVATKPEDVFAVIFTSGSTGMPKGVLLQQKGVYNCFQYTNSRFQIGERDRLFSVTDLCHDMCIYEMLGMLLAGGAIVMPTAAERRDIGKWIELLKKYSVTFWSCVPTFMEMLLIYIEGRKEQAIELPSLRYVLLGGGFMKISLYDRLRSIAEQVELYNIGGPTETSMWNIIHKVTAQDIKNQRIPYGKPIWNTQYHILDENLQYVEVNETGIIYNSGIGVAKGYTDLELTEKKFILHPDLQIRMYNTGDLGRYNSQGEIEILGRSDLQIKKNGKRIELEEIECNLKKDPRVVEAVAVGTEDEKIHAYLKIDEQRDSTKNSLWKDVFDKAYKEQVIENNIFDFSGWTSSYTREQINTNEMMEWLNRTSSRILECKPKNVLEIGCGTGLILKKIIAHVDSYIGLDLSEVAVEKLNAQLKSNPSLNDKTEVFQGSADDFSLLQDKTFDTIIINSVIMFFGSEQYLTKVINQCLELLTDNGNLFIGDIIDFNLLSLFRTTVNYYQTDNGTVKDIQKKIAQDYRMVKDFCVSPKYFEKILFQNKHIAGIQVRVKDMKSVNEVSKYRYDVTIRKGARLRNGLEEAKVYDFALQKMDLRQLENLLMEANEKETKESFVIKNVPNQFLVFDQKVQEWIEQADKEKEITKLKEELAGQETAGDLPMQFYEMGVRYGYQCAIKNTENNRMEVFYTKGIPDNILPDCNQEKEVANIPYKLSEEELFIKELRTSLKRLLPDYMIPAYFNIMEEIPHLSNGKPDRKALQDLAKKRTYEEKENSSPGSVKEEIKQLWSRVLQSEEVFHEDESFWEQGGHSLLALQLLTIIREKYHCEISLTDFFESPTLHYLLDCINNADEIQPDNTMKKLESQPKSKDTEEFELSELQQAYLIARKSNLPFTKIATHCYLELEFHDFDMNRFTAAVERLVERHEMLRCYFTEDGKQGIKKALGKMPITVTDISELSQSQYEEYLLDTRHHMNLENIDYTDAPLFKLHVSKSGQQALVHFYYDGLIMDGYSKNIFLHDLDEYYHMTEKEKKEEKKIVRFQDYIQNYHARRTEQAHYQKAKEYWLQHMDSLPSIPDIPVNQENNVESNIDSSQYKALISLEKWEKIKENAKKYELTSFSVLLTAFCKVIARWCKEQEFLINVPLIDRGNNLSGENDFIGETATFLLFDFHNETTAFYKLAKKIQFHLYELIENRSFTGIDILRELTKRSGSIGTGVAPIVFTSLLDIPMVEENSFSCTYFESYTSQVWMDAIASVAKEGILFTWDCRKGIFENDMVIAMQKAFIEMLESLAEDAAIWEKNGTVALPERDQKLIAQINHTEHSIGKASMGEKICEAMETHRQNIAVIDKNVCYTYEEIGNKVKALAYKLVELQLGRNDVITVMLEKGQEQLVAALAITYAGAVYAPIEYELPVKRVKQAVESIDGRLMLTDSKKEREFFIDGTFPMKILDITKLDLKSKCSMQPVIQEATDVFAVIFTSGSTGNPKGVYIEHQGIVNCMEFTNQYFGISEKDRILSLTNICHDMSLYDLYGFFTTGGTIVFPQAAKVKEPKHWIELLMKYQITFWESVPTMMEMLFIELEKEQKENIFPSMKTIVLGGEFLPVYFYEKVKKYAKNARLYNTGGPTETTVWNIMHNVTEDDAKNQHIPYGKPIWNTQYHILNDLLEPVPAGVTGTIYNSGIGLAKGYTDRELTAKKFIWHKELKTVLYNTGDLGRYRADGEIDILGRDDLQVKVNGKRIELGEIKYVLNQYQGITDCAVKYDKETNSIQAFYVSQEEMDSKELMQYMLLYLPDYMVPRIYQRIPYLPVLPNGKLDLHQLNVDWDKQIVQDDSQKLQYTKLQNQILDIIKKQLQLPNFDPQMNFFMAGGDSLKGLRIVTELNQELGLNAAITDILTAKTIETFMIQADSYSKESPAAEKDMENIATDYKKAPLSYAQEGVWFDCIRESENRFVVPVYVDITGDLDVNQLSTALEQTAVKYSLVKAAILVDEEFNPYQEIQEERKLEIEQIHLEKCRLEEKKKAVYDIQQEMMSLSMDIEQDMLCRVVLAYLGEKEYRLYLIFHHIITDDMSIKIFLKNLFSNYGKEKQLGKNYTQMYFEHCKREKMHSFSEEEKHFFKELVDKSEYLNIPGQMDATKKALEGGYISFELDEKKTAAFQKICAFYGASLNIGLLSVYAVMLHQVSGKEKITIGTPFSSRNQEESEMIGLLVNLELLCLEIKQEDEFASVIKKVRQSVLYYIGKKYPPYVDLCRILKAPREKMMIPHHIVYNYLEDEELAEDILLNQELKISSVVYVNSQVSHNLGLMVNHTKGKIYGEFSYNQCYLDELAVDAMKECFKKILDSVVNTSLED